MGLLKNRLNLVGREEGEERQRGRREKSTVCLEKLMQSKKADGKRDLITQKWLRRGGWAGREHIWEQGLTWGAALKASQAGVLRARDNDRRKEMREFEALLLDKGRSRRKGKSSKVTGCSPSQSTLGCEFKGFHHSNFSSRSCKESPTHASSFSAAALPLSFTVPLWNRSPSSKYHVLSLWWHTHQ